MAARGASGGRTSLVNHSTGALSVAETSSARVSNVIEASSTMSSTKSAT